MKTGNRPLTRARAARLYLGLACASLLASPALAAELKLAEAIRLALAQNADILVQAEQVTSVQGQRQQASGLFDTVLSAGVSQNRSITPLATPSASGSTRQSKTITTGYQLGLNKNLLNGMTLASTLDASAEQNTSADGVSMPAKNIVRLGLTLNLPLLKGSGSEVTGLGLQLAELNLQAARQEMRRQTSLVLLNTLSAYWDYLARQELEKLATATARRSQQLLNSTQKLVEAAERPRGDLVLLKADYVDKLAAQQTASVALMEARRNLGRLLGVSNAVAEALAAPGDVFPAEFAPSPRIEQLARMGEALAEYALQVRPDIQAAQLQVEGAQLQMRVAEKKLKPQLDLNFGVSVAKASEGGSRVGFITDNGRVQSEPSVSAKLSYEFAVGNQQAEGVYKERSANLAQMQIKYRDTALGSANSVNSALQRLTNSAEQLRAAKQSLALYEQAVNQEMIKQKNGIATLIDVITIEGRFNGAQSNVISLQAEYAKALAKLRYESGTLLPAPVPNSSQAGAGKENIQLDIAGLTSLQPVMQALKLAE